ncbi:hypothetical protein E7T09_00265 [Deinococcus sp. KSM4-11]|uniref:hypothetical protein n=1 Tax=Deinococcus sp. KSM4-11 TaxID=2568654 RepID=UPI0010A2B5D2|nr:hypothetical protein [Deinococcus sp. KSM4-11]THF87718.1 hypothetical protein E7T09_00265 [Deinococcus sp. KSM4-11]
MTSTLRAGSRMVLLVGSLLGGLAAAQAPVRPGAAVGASSVGRLTTTTRVTISDVRASAVEGTAVDPATLAAIRRDLGRAAPDWTLTLDGKAFTVVTARSAQDITLRTTLVLAPEGGVAATARSTRTLGADGGSGPEQLEPIQGEAAPLPPGWPLDGAWSGGPVPLTGDLNAAPLLDLLLRALAGPDTRMALMQGVQAAPVPVATTSMPSAPDADGQQGTAIQRAYGPWTLTTGGQGTLPRVTFTLGSAVGEAQGTGTMTLRRDGLTQTTSSETRLPVHVTLVSRGVQVTLTLTIEQRSEFRPA